LGVKGGFGGKKDEALINNIIKASYQHCLKADEEKTHFTTKYVWSKGKLLSRSHQRNALAIFRFFSTTVPVSAEDIW
jgi:hypothetical protein